MVQKLKASNVPLKRIQEITGVSERTVRQIVQEPTISDADDALLHQSRQVGRRSTVIQYEAQIRQWLSEPRSTEDGPMKSQEVLSRLREQGYQGGRTAVYDLVRQLRPNQGWLYSCFREMRFQGWPW